MVSKNPLLNLSAARATASVFGVLAGLGGFMHGVGEMLQGNVAAEGLIINSWTQGPIAAYMGGEPGMTLVPNLLVTGLLTILVSLALIIWSAVFVERNHGGLVLLLLAIAMLLVGGGFGPPIIGILAGVAGLGLHSTNSGWAGRLPTGGRQLLGGLWPWVFAITAANGLFLVVGSLILVYLFALNQPDLFVNSFFFAIVSLLLTLITGAAYDSQKLEPAVGAA